MDPKHIDELRLLTGDPSRVIINPQIVEQLSRDFYWYSPVLRKQLDGKLGEVVVQPLSAVEIQKLLRYCHANNLAVTARGAGTGNYGQAVPLEGGVVFDFSPHGSHRGNSTGGRGRLPAGSTAGRHRE